jgi:cytochrome b
VTRRIVVWDWAIRLVHWLIAGLVAFSWWSAKNDHLPWHRLSGYTILALLLFRLGWGLAGSQTARFRSFVKGPAAVWAYVRGHAGGFVGHSPLGALSVVAMIAALCVQVGLGLFTVDEDGLEPGPLARFVSFDTGRAIAHIHHLWFNVILALVALHLAAIAFYEVRGKRLVWPMITGRVAAPDETIEPQSGRPWVLAVLAVLAGAIAWVVAHGLRLSGGQP